MQQLGSVSASRRLLIWRAYPAAMRRRHQAAGARERQYHLPGADKAVAALAVVAVVLVGLSLLTRYLAYRRELATPGIAPPSWMVLFDVNAEANVPTWFTVALMVFAGAVAAGAGLVIYPTSRSVGRFFLALAAVLLLLSLDEFVGLHERLGTLGAAALGRSALHFTWVVPGALLAGILLVALLLGGRSLPRATRRRLTVALAVYLTGVLVVEAVSGQVLLAYGDRAAYLLVTGVEELLEMLGLLLVLRAVLGSIQAERVGEGWLLRPVGSHATAARNSSDV